MKKLLPIFALLLAILPARAADVSLSMAQAAAHRFLHNLSARQGINAMSITDVKLLHAEASSHRADQPVYYIFNSNRGFVIVAGDNRAQQILAYGDRQLDMKRMPDNMKFWLGTYKTQIEYLQAHPGLVVEQPKMKAGMRASLVGPLLTAEWDQGYPYYNHCPVYNGVNCLTGCPATSLSMVFYYWKYPTDPTDEIQGYINQTGGFEVPALPSITFDWDNMLDKYTGSFTTAQADAVAWLMRYVGQEEHMNYSSGGSGAYSEDILRAINFFGYDDNAHVVYKTRTDDNAVDTAVYYTDEEWTELLQDELDEGRPVVYCAYDYNTWFGWSGHAFNVDGYNASTSTFHVNWGWSGEGNGDFALNAFTGNDMTYNIEQQMILGIQPPPQGPVIKVNPAKLYLSANVDETATATFTVRGQYLDSNITLTLNDESGAFAIDANSVSMAEQENGKVITVTYAPKSSGTHTATITLSNPDAQDKTVTISGMATLDTHKPVLSPANEQFINLTQFRADWTDQTLSKYVDSYTLEVSTRPAVELLATLDGSDYPGGYNNVPLVEPWSGEGLMGGHSTMYISNSFFDGYVNFTVPGGYSNDTFTIQITTATDSYGSGDVTVGSTQTAPTGHWFTYGETHTWTVTASSGEIISITSSEEYYSPDMSMIRVYAGDVNEMNTIRANEIEQGDATYRLITGITDKCYTVKNLTPGGNFFFKVKATYVDGTSSAWSNVQSVTLFDNGHGYQPGDVNHDGKVNISDVTALIDLLLGSAGNACTTCADVDSSGNVNIADVTALIDNLLQGN